MIHTLHVNSFTLKSAVIAGLYDTYPRYISMLHRKKIYVKGIPFVFKSFSHFYPRAAYQLVKFSLCIMRFEYSTRKDVEDTTKDIEDTWIILCYHLLAM